jgi:hypothetical protein
MPNPRYGHISYELPKAIEFAFDVIDHGGLASAAEQYPNAISAIDRGQLLETALKFDVAGYAPAAVRNAANLARMLINVWSYGITEDGLVTLSNLQAAAEAVMMTMPQDWQIIDHGVGQGPRPGMAA